MAPEMGDDIEPRGQPGYLLQGGGRAEEPQPPPAPTPRLTPEAAPRRPRPMSPEDQGADGVEETASPPDNNTRGPDEVNRQPFLPDEQMRARVNELLSICARLQNVAARSMAELFGLQTAFFAVALGGDLERLVQRAEDAATRIENQVQAHMLEHLRTGRHDTVLIFRVVEARELVIQIETELQQVQRHVSQLR